MLRFSITFQIQCTPIADFVLQHWKRKIQFIIFVKYRLIFTKNTFGICDAANSWETICGETSQSLREKKEINVHLSFDLLNFIGINKLLNYLLNVCNKGKKRLTEGDSPTLLISVTPSVLNADHNKFIFLLISNSIVIINLKTITTTYFTY